jgi:hypothetical protein
VLAGQDSRRFNAGFTLYGTVMGVKARLLLERGHYLLCKAVLVEVFRRSIILAIATGAWGMHHPSPSPPDTPR